MPEDSMLLVTGVAFLLAGLVKGAIGMGLPTVAVALLSLAMPPALAAALYVFPSLATNTWQSVAGPNLLGLLRRLGVLFACVVLGIWAGAGMLTGDTSGHAVVALGITLSVYAVLGLTSLDFKVAPSSEWWLSPIIGLVSGLVAGATGIFVIPVVPYLQALQMDREQLIQAMGLSFLISTVALALVLARAGILDAGVALTSALAILPALAGMYLGQLLRQRVSQKAFRTLFFLGMLGLGLHLAARIFR